MNKKTELVYALNALFSACNTHELDAAKIPQRLETLSAIDQLDYDMLIQAIRAFAETVYDFIVIDETCDSCAIFGRELFGCRATVLRSKCVWNGTREVLMDRYLELYLLEDCSFALVSCTGAQCYSEGGFSADYRVIQSTDLDEIVQEIDHDLEGILKEIKRLMTSYNQIGCPFYEI